MTELSPDTESTLTSAVVSPISRRTVLAGTAFAVPAVVLTASAPAFAASGLSLAFDKSVYSGQACTTISGAKVSATNGGAPKAGVSVTVSLSNGYTFSTGGTSSTGVTGSDGSRTLPDINVPVGNTSGTATATAAGATSTTATLSGTAVETPKYLQGGTPTDPTGVPAGSTPVAAGIFLTSDGRLIDGGSNGAVMSTNVDTFGQLVASNGGWRIPLKKKNGAVVYLQGGTETTPIGVPAGSAPVAAAIFLTSDGRLVDGGSGGAVMSTNVDTYGQLIASSTGWRIPLKKTNGAVVYLESGTETTPTGVPAGSAPVAAGIFLTSDGRLIDGGSNGAVMSTNVDTYGQLIASSSGWRIPLKKKNGTVAYLQGGTETTPIGVPAGSTPAAAAIFLTSDGRLIDGGSNGAVLSTNVDTYGQLVASDSGWRMPYLEKKTSC